MATVTRKFYGDPGHGWLAVKTAELVDLGIAGDISTYSYQKGKSAYLEEDSDAGKYIRAMAARGTTVVLMEKHIDGRSPIRSYPSYAAP